MDKCENSNPEHWIHYQHQYMADKTEDAKSKTKKQEKDDKKEKTQSTPRKRNGESDEQNGMAREELKSEKTKGKTETKAVDPVTQSPPSPNLGSGDSNGEPSPVKASNKNMSLKASTMREKGKSKRTIRALLRTSSQKMTDINEKDKDGDAAEDDDSDSSAAKGRGRSGTLRKMWDKRNSMIISKLSTSSDSFDKQSKQQDIKKQNEEPENGEHKRTHHFMQPHI